ncbi:MAG: histidine kinase dimerization/phospho-acceptor domain-containing protein [Acutalibacteraceae bacterium]
MRFRPGEDFVAAFAHELKTPLTSIIGYADALRSRRLDEEKQFMSANYIYTEGKRLEAMSFRLLDIMVTRRRRGGISPWCRPNPCFCTCMTCT